MPNIFSLTISGITAERKDQERSAIVYVLHQIANEVGSGAPLRGIIKDGSGAEIATYGFGPHAINHDGR
jgi:hypothetical protein